MASAQKNQDEFNAWLQMQGLQQQNFTPNMSQMAEQASEFPIGGMSLPPSEPPMQEMGGMSMMPPPPPKPVPVVSKKPTTTAQPTTMPIGEVPQEMVPQQIPMMAPKKLSLAEEIDLSYKNLGAGQALQQEEVNAMKERLAKYAGESRGVDFTPLAALLDSWYGGNLTAAAKQIAPESAAQKTKNLADMQMAIAEAQGKISAGEREAMKERLAQLGYEQQRKTAVDVALIGASARKTNEMLEQREEARREKQTLDYANHIGKQAITMAENFRNLEQGLGFRIDDIDTKTGRVKGKKVDIPGISLPGVGRLNWTDAAADINARFSPIFNTVLRDRSGLAVTSHELENLRKEFAQGKFNTEEKMLAAVKRFKDAAVQALRAQEAGYVPEIRERYRGQGGHTVDDLFMQDNKKIDDDLNADLNKMSDAELRAWVEKHGGQ